MKDRRVNRESRGIRANLGRMELPVYQDPQGQLARMVSMVSMDLRGPAACQEGRGHPGLVAKWDNQDQKVTWGLLGLPVCQDPSERMESPVFLALLDFLDPPVLPGDQGKTGWMGNKARQGWRARLSYFQNR
mmetsp:Transcript_7985/g.26753  ORF Transcript_7985/g.26753 Transcript_7985/m.26753 type:complete len:132 (-) Transcript_7985:289-684(-)